MKYHKLKWKKCSTHKSFDIRKAWESFEDISASFWVMHQVLSILKRHLHFLQHTCFFRGVNKKRNGLSAVITIKLLGQCCCLPSPFRPLVFRQWLLLCWPPPCSPVHCLQTPRQISGAFLSIIKMLLQQMKEHWNSLASGTAKGNKSIITYKNRQKAKSLWFFCIFK